MNKKSINIIIIILGVILISSLLLLATVCINKKSEEPIWNIKVTSIKILNKSSDDNVKYEPEVLTDASVKFGVNLKKEDTVTYLVTIENNGTIDAEFKNIIVDDLSNSNIRYEIKNKKVVKADSSTNIKIKLYNDKNNTTKQADFSAIFVYKQKGL